MKKHFSILAVILGFGGGIALLWYGLRDQDDRSEPEQKPRITIRETNQPPADSPEDTASTPDSERESGPETSKAMRVEKAGKGTYTFHIEHDLSVSVPPDRTVGLQFYFGSQKVSDAHWHNVLSSDRSRISFHERLGSEEEKVPPGLYRARLTISPPLDPRPNPLVQTINQRKAAKGVEVSDVFSEDRTVFEFVVPVGPDRKREAFRTSYRSSFLEKGNELIEAWDHWYERAREMYDAALQNMKNKKRARSKKEQIMKKQYRKLLNRLRDLEYAYEFTRGFFKRYRNQYIVLPNREHRMKLRDFNRYVYKKVKHMMPTVLIQTIGSIPPDYPDKYPRSGFSPRLHLKNHMEQFHKERVKNIRELLEEKSSSQPPLATLDRYVKYQTHRLYRIPRAVQEIAEGPVLWELRTNLPGSELERNHFFRKLYRCTRERLRMRAVTLRHAAPHLDDPERTRQVQKDIEQARKYLIVSIQQLAEAVDFQLPSSLRNKYDQLQHPENVRSFAQRRLSN